MWFEEREIRYSVRYDLDLASRHVMNGTEEFVALFRHDDDFCRNVDDPTHHVALDGRRFGEHRVQCRDDRHFESRQELDDIAAGLAAENPVFVLKRNNVESCAVQELGRLDIIADRFVVNLEAHSRRIVIGAVRIRHSDDAGLKIRPGGRDRPVKILGKCRDAAQARKIVPDEGHALKRFHLIVSRRPLFGAAFSCVREVGTRISFGRSTSIEPGCVRRCSRCGIGPPPVYATRATMPVAPG